MADAPNSAGGRGTQKTGAAIGVTLLILSVAWLYNHRHAKTLVTPPTVITLPPQSLATIPPPAQEPPMVDGSVGVLLVPAPPPVHSHYCAELDWANLPPGAYCRGWAVGELWRGGKVVRIGAPVRGRD